MNTLEDVQMQQHRPVIKRVSELKERPCMDCRVSYPPYVMDFDHRPGEKKLGGIRDMVKYGWKVVEAEIAKCDVVCSNCHRIRTHVRRARDVL